jgi:LPXTG-site transpeptidase (sortase) family protein
MNFDENNGAGGGFLGRLRENETLRKITGGRPDIAIFGVPALVIALIVAAVIGVAVASGGGGDDEQAVAGSPTAAQSATPATTSTVVHAGEKTPISFDPGDQLTLTDLANRGAGQPGRGNFNGERLLIPSIGVDAGFSVKQVPSSGIMPNPNGPSDVAFYDFSMWPCCGGTPDEGGNIVLAGHVDYINVGPAVFWDLDKLAVGDKIQIRKTDGTIAEYAVEFNKYLPIGEGDWTAVVSATADESITLITCTGDFQQGHYNQRQIVWGRRLT